ncbi:uncharacterized protein TNCV_4688141 [Trichonephila clavipes]|nr:uncharacterized protein TNCV_4688141 [Trichonephila clavipes]
MTNLSHAIHKPHMNWYRRFTGLTLLDSDQPLTTEHGCSSPVVKVSDHGRHVMSSSPVSLKTHRVGQRCTLDLSRAETSSRWFGAVVRRRGANSGVVHVT